MVRIYWYINMNSIFKTFTNVHYKSKIILVVCSCFICQYLMWLNPASNTVITIVTIKQWMRMLEPIFTIKLIRMIMISLTIFTLFKRKLEPVLQIQRVNFSQNYDQAGSPNNKFGWNEDLVTTYRYLCTKIIDNNVKKFRYNEHPLMARSHTWRRVQVWIPVPGDIPMATVVQCRKFTLDQNRDRYLSLIGLKIHPRCFGMDGSDQGPSALPPSPRAWLMTRWHAEGPRPDLSKPKQRVWILF